MVRTLNEDERWLMGHISMFGSAGYPVRKIGSKWVCGSERVKGPPTMFRTKKEAVASFEAWRDAMRALLGEEARERHIADLKARGYSDEAIHRMKVAAREHEARTN